MTPDRAIRIAETAARDLGFPWDPRSVRAVRRRVWPFPATWLVVSTVASPAAHTAMRVSERRQAAFPVRVLYPAAAMALRRPISRASLLRFAAAAAIAGAAAFLGARLLLDWPLWACALVALAWALLAPVIAIGIRHDRAADLDSK